MAVILEASLLLGHGDASVGEIFCASRLQGDGGFTFGSLRSTRVLKSVIERHRPRSLTGG
jgi:putative acyl-CoA dehydrogenase